MLYAPLFLAAPSVVPNGCPWGEQRYAKATPVANDKSAIDVEFECTRTARPLTIGTRIALSGLDAAEFVVKSTNLAEFPDPCAAGVPPTFRLATADAKEVAGSIPEGGSAFCLGKGTAEPGAVRPARRLAKVKGIEYNLPMAQLLKHEKITRPSIATLPIPPALFQPDKVEEGCASTSLPIEYDECHGSPPSCEVAHTLPTTCFGGKLLQQWRSFDIFIKDGYDMAQVRICDGGTKLNREMTCSYNSLTATHQGRVEILFKDEEGGIKEAEWGSLCMASKSGLFTSGDNAWPMLAGAMGKVVCKQLGFDGAMTTTWRDVWNTAPAGPGVGPVWAYVGPPGAGNLYCRGDEAKISECGVMRKVGKYQTQDGDDVTYTGYKPMAKHQKWSSGKVQAQLYQVSAGVLPWYALHEFAKTASVWFAPSSVLLLDTFVQDRMAISNLYTERRKFVLNPGEYTGANTDLDSATLYSSKLEETKYQDEGRLLEVAEEKCTKQYVVCAAVLQTRLIVSADASGIPGHKDGAAKTDALWDTKASVCDGLGYATTDTCYPGSKDSDALAMRASEYLFGVDYDYTSVYNHKPDSFVIVHKDSSGKGILQGDSGYPGIPTGLRAPQYFQHLCRRNNKFGAMTNWFCQYDQTMFTAEDVPGTKPVRARAEPVELDAGVHLLRWLTVLDYNGGFPLRVDARNFGMSPWQEKLTLGTTTSLISMPFTYIEYALWSSFAAVGPTAEKTTMALVTDMDLENMKLADGTKYQNCATTADCTCGSGADATTEVCTPALTSTFPVSCEYRDYEDKLKVKWDARMGNWKQQYCPIADPAGLITLDEYTAVESKMTREERIIKVPSNPLMLKAAGLHEVIDEQAHIAWRSTAVTKGLVKEPILSEKLTTKLKSYAKPSSLRYYDHRYSGVTLESWSCHHPNDVVVACDDGIAGTFTQVIPLPPNAPPPPSPAAPPPAPCADNFCRMRKYYAEHNPLEYVVWSALVNIAYYEWWHPEAAWMLEPAKKVLNFCSGLLQLTPTLAGVFDKVVARSKVLH